MTKAVIHKKAKLSKLSKPPRNQRAERLLKALNEKQKHFCREYVIDWDGTRSYLVAYPNVKNRAIAKAAASRLLTNVNLKKYISEIKDDLEMLCGVSKAMIVNEHKKLATSSIADLHDTWITRKEFETLTKEQKDCIAEIDTKIKTEFEFDPDNPKDKKPITVEYVKVKLYDKQKALDSISKLMGYDAEQKIKISGNITGDIKVGFE
jgi:phage terminase small subunit